jgi:hypothetical protein
MPSSFVKKIAEKEGMSIEDAEKKWQRAVEIAKKQGAEDVYALATTIFKGDMSNEVSSTKKKDVEETSSAAITTTAAGVQPGGSGVFRSRLNFGDGGKTSNKNKKYVDYLLKRFR